MPRYFMNFIAKTMLADDAGYDFETDEIAIAHAEAMAKDLAKTALLSGCAILVTDEADNTIIEIPLNYLDS